MFRKQAKKERSVKNTRKNGQEREGNETGGDQVRKVSSDMVGRLGWNEK